MKALRPFILGVLLAAVLTLGGCVVWAIIDLVNIITGKFTDVNGQPLRRA